MNIHTTIKKNTYFDSISLMSISTNANEIDGVNSAMIGMGTEMNIEVIRNVGLYTDELEDVTTGDLMIVLDVEPGSDKEEILKQVDELFVKKNNTDAEEVTYRTLEGALKEQTNSNIVVISINGQFAYREANKALDNDKHVMIFSDNVTVEEEIKLKQKAHEKNLFVMGPDCGTAIINGVGLAFANKVRRGDIGIVGASGTGSQEVSVQIHKHGYGVSQLIGTGGRDLSTEVGGRMMLDGIDALIEDKQTNAILLISKPPAADVEEKILEKLKETTKPVVIYFIGSEKTASDLEHVHFAKSSLDAVKQVITYSKTSKAEESIYPNPSEEIIKQTAEKFTDTQQYIRGLFGGGTLCDEILYAVSDISDEVYSNIHKKPEYQLKNVNESIKHTMIDFGDDEFTQGRPHPMIDPTTRQARIIQEARDPEVAVIAMDFEIGYGSHENPAGVLKEAIEEANKIAQADGRNIAFVGYVLGTDEDVQGLEKQRDILEDLGVLVVDSSQALYETSISLIKGA